MIKDLLKNIKIFFILSNYSLRSTLDHRTGVIIFVLGKILRFIFYFGFIFLIFSQTKFLKGYQLNQAIIIYLTFNLIDTITQILFREVYRFRPLVVSGNFDLILVKPFSPLFRVLLGGIDFLDFLLLFPYLALLSFFLILYPPLLIINYSLLIINSLIIATAFHILVLSSGILFTTVDHAIMIYRDLTSFGRFPFEIYPKNLRNLFTFVLPIGLMFAFPPKALFGLLSKKIIFITFLISLALLMASLKIWHLALKKYQAVGG